MLSERDRQDFDFVFGAEDPDDGNWVSDEDLRKMTAYERRVVRWWLDLTGKPFRKDWLPVLKRLLADYQPAQIRRAIEAFVLQGRQLSSLQYLVRPLRNGAFGPSRLEQKRGREKHDRKQPQLRKQPVNRNPF